MFFGIFLPSGYKKSFAFTICEKYMVEMFGYALCLQMVFPSRNIFFTKNVSLLDEKNQTKVYIL